MLSTRPFRDPSRRPRAASPRGLALRAGAATALVGGAVLLGAPAQAHVSVTPSSTAAGSYSVLTFSVGHGCEGSPTTTMTFALPESVVAVTPTVNPNWTVEKKMEKLAQPVDDGHGGQYTERVAQVVYTARTPLPDGYRDTLALQVQLPDTVGEKFVVPVVQTCEKGSTSWTQTYEDGQPEPEAPAPFLTVTAAEGEGHGASHDNSATGDHEEADGTQEAAGHDAAESGGSTVPGWIGLVLGALGLLAGGTALARSRATS